MKGVLLVAVLMLAGCSSGETETVEITTKVQATTTVATPTPATEPVGNDPDDVDGQLDIRNLNATRTGDLLAVSLTTYEPWSSNVLVGPGPNRYGPNRLTIFYDVDLDGAPDYRGKIVYSGGELSLYLTGEGQAFEPIPVERPNNVTTQFVHLVDVLFVPSGGGSSEVDIQIRVKSFYNRQEDKAPDAGKWLGVPFNP